MKKGECWRIDAFELWCWRRLLRVPWTTSRSNQSILKEFSPGISLEGMMLKLKLQYFGNLMRRVDSLEKTLMLGGIGGRRRKVWQRMRWLDGITDSMDVSLEWTPGVGDRQGGLACCDSWGHKESDMTATELNWTELRVSYLVVQGLGVSASTPKAQGLISSPRTDEMKMISLFFRPPVVVIPKSGRLHLQFLCIQRASGATVPL